MKIKYKKKLSESSCMKLTIKISEYELNDKITKNEVNKIIDIVTDIACPNKNDFSCSSEGLPCEEKKKC